MKAPTTPNGFKKTLLTTPTGGSFTVKRRPGQTHKAWVNTLANSRSKLKKAHGVSSIVSFAGDTATITIVSGLDKTPAAVAAELDKKELRQAVRSMAPAPPPKEPPMPTSEEARAFFKDCYIESFRAMPLASAEIHSRAAREAAQEFARRWPENG